MVQFVVVVVGGGGVVVVGVGFSYCLLLYLPI